MGGMLVDDDDAVARLGDDIGLVQLGARNAKRKVVRRGLGLWLKAGGWRVIAGAVFRKA